MQRRTLPYTLLYDPDTGRAAAYTNNHQPIAELASQKLIDYALQNTARRAAFDRALHAQGAPQWRPLPAWASADVLDRLVLLWLKRPDADDEAAWCAIPRR